MKLKFQFTANNAFLEDKSGEGFWHWGLDGEALIYSAQFPSFVSACEMDKKLNALYKAGRDDAFKEVTAKMYGMVDDIRMITR